MDMMERYKIEASIEDVIAILDSAPIHRDLNPETNLVQLTNRIPIAHLAIERGLKALIGEAGGSTENIHGLNRLYRDLKECDQGSADYLATAFQDAVSFYRYNANTRGFAQFRSLDDYLSRVGTEKAFESLRYWAIGETGKGESPFPYISPLIHREILCALWCIFLSGRRELVSERVEREVQEAMCHRRWIKLRDGDTKKEISIRWYMNWLLREHLTRRSALEAAVRKNFAVKDDDELIIQTLRDAYTDLRESKDPAVIYFVSTLTYLPEGSQTRNPKAMPEMEWFNQDQTRGMVTTPAGSCLGFVEKGADGAWEITPQEEGLVQVSDVAKTLGDAKNYLVNRLTRQVTATINGESKQLRMITERDIFPLAVWNTNIENSADLSTYAPTYELEFWNVDHGISPEDEISVELPSDTSCKIVSILEGTVETVAEQKVSVVGTERTTSRDAVECWADNSAK